MMAKFFKVHVLVLTAAVIGAVVLLMQFVYKTIWLLAIYLPASTDAASSLLPVMVAGVLVDAVVIPWGGDLRRTDPARRYVPVT